MEGEEDDGLVELRNTIKVYPETIRRNTAVGPAAAVDIPPQLPASASTPIRPTLIKLLTWRLLVFSPLLCLVILTNSRFWAKNTKYSVVLLQTMTAIVGLLVALLLSECCWMVQGAVAAAWTWRSRGRRTSVWWERRQKQQQQEAEKASLLPLVVAESIQTGRPASIMGSGAGFQEFLLVIIVPMAATFVSATYKFGISLHVLDTTMDAIIATTFLSMSVDRGAYYVQGCDRADDLCSTGKLRPRFGTMLNAIDYVDYTWATGVEIGKNFTPTAFRLLAGDAPAIDEDTIVNILGGVTYSQQTMDVTVDCGRYSTSPWPSTCNNPPIQSTALSDLSACESGSTIAGVVNFRPESLGLSCQFTLTMYMRPVNARPVASSWRIRQNGGPRTEVPNQFWGVSLNDWRTQLINSITRSIEDTPALGPCLYGCKRRPASFQAGVSAKISVLMAQELHARSRYSAGEVVPLPGVKSLGSNVFVEVLSPSGRIAIQGFNPNTTINIGSNARLNVKDNEFIAVNYWVLLFGLLPVVEMIAALVKWKYACHPMDAICGVLWTLGKSEKTRKQGLVNGVLKQDSTVSSSTLEYIPCA
ncbi:hypothetical protein HDU67_006794 [Dinochytrium kinnereticum]|nr:hypothetical protein HDU67_006794 [Dinochytrium kinnereticum]